MHHWSFSRRAKETIYGWWSSPRLRCLEYILAIWADLNKQTIGNNLDLKYRLIGPFKILIISLYDALEQICCNHQYVFSEITILHSKLHSCLNSICENIGLVNSACFSCCHILMTDCLELDYLHAVLFIFLNAKLRSLPFFFLLLWAAN